MQPTSYVRQDDARWTGVKSGRALAMRGRLSHAATTPI